MQTKHPILVHRRREHDDEPLNDRLLRKSVRSGRYRRVVAGSYVRETDWKQLTPMQQHLVRVLEVADRARGPIVFTHSAAAAIQSIDRIGAWPRLVDVRIAQSSGEFDGVGKYFDPEILAGRTPDEALLEEKDRADALRRQVSGLSRWRTPDHRDPGQLYSILVTDGLPSQFPPPRIRTR